MSSKPRRLPRGVRGYVRARAIELARPATRAMSDPLARWALRWVRLDGRPFRFEGTAWGRLLGTVAVSLADGDRKAKLARAVHLRNVERQPGSGSVDPLSDPYHYPSCHQPLPLAPEFFAKKLFELGKIS